MSSDGTMMRVSVPFTAKTGKIFLIIRKSAGGGTEFFRPVQYWIWGPTGPLRRWLSARHLLESAETFTVDRLPLTVTDFFPKEYHIGDELILVGTGFVPSLGSRDAGVRDGGHLIGLGLDLRTQNPFWPPHGVNGDGTRLKVFVMTEGYLLKKQEGKGKIHIDNVVSEGQIKVVGKRLHAITRHEPTEVRPGDLLSFYGTGFIPGREKVYELYMGPIGSSGIPRRRLGFLGNGAKYTSIGAEWIHPEGTVLRIRVPRFAESGKPFIWLNTRNAWEWVKGPGEIKVVSQNFSVTDVQPRTAKSGDILTVTGSEFLAKASYNIIYFHAEDNNQIENHAASAFEVNAEGTEFKVVVPPSPRAKSSDALFFLSSGDQKVKFSHSFRLESVGTLGLTDFSPKSARVGQVITVRGRGFHSHAWDPDLVYFGSSNPLGQASVPYDVSPDRTELKVRVPSNARTGKLWIRRKKTKAPTDLFTIRGLDPLSYDPFSLDDYEYVKSTEDFVFRDVELRLTGFEPKIAPVGAEIAIRGTGFSLRAGDNRVSIGSLLVHAYVLAHEVNADGTEIKVRVPSFVSQNGLIRVGVGLSEVISEESFKIGPTPVPPSVPEEKEEVKVSDSASLSTSSFVGLRVYPNPIRGDILHLAWLENKRTFLRVLDLSGQVFYSGVLMPVGHEISLRLSLRRGTYLVYLSRGRQLRTLLFFKE
ncbi:MAG: hypothetical protein OXB93_00815 [Cytophagales bacterium]|nr:hypothetical protein [Cytophagales bacterium]